MTQLATVLLLLVFAAESTAQLWHSGTRYAECLQYYSFTSLFPTGQHPPCHPAFLSCPLSFTSNSPAITKHPSPHPRKQNTAFAGMFVNLHPSTQPILKGWIHTQWNVIYSTSLVWSLLSFGEQKGWEQYTENTTALCQEARQNKVPSSGVTHARLPLR
jgi:hypothetical protein